MNIDSNRLQAWGTVVATVVAIAAFFRPDVQPLLKGEKVQVELTKNIVLNHRIGVLWMLPFVSLSNEGGKTVAIRDTSLFFINRDGKAIKLEADSYLRRTPNDDAFFPWTTIPLAPGEHWTERVNFREPLSAEQEDEFRGLVARLGRRWGKDYYDSRMPKGKAPEKPDQELDLLRKDTNKFFAANFRLHHGAYKILVIVRDGAGSILDMKSYEMTLAERTIEALKRSIDLYFESSPTLFDSSILTEVPIVPITDSSTTVKLLELVKSQRLL